MAKSDHMLCIPLKNDTKTSSAYVIINVTSTGSHDLDLKLVATEGEAAYVGSVSPSRIGKLQTKNSPITADQWESALLSILLQRRQDPKSKDYVDNLETVANVSDTHLTLAFRKNISGIHQRLGEISLKIDEKEDPNLVAWVQTATTRAGLLDEQVSSLQEKFDEQSEVIKRLELHFEELSKASKEHEETLLQKCCELLNEKKGKIRDQQRLLAVAKIDPAKAAELDATRTSNTHRDAKPSRHTKRKASAQTSESESGFEATTTTRHARTKTPETSEEDENPPVSSAGSRTETEDEDEDSESAAVVKDSQPVLRDSQPLQKGKESKKEVSKKGDKDNSKEGSKEGNTKGGKDGSKDNSKEGKDKPTLPPKRNLPFAKPTTRQAQKQVDKDVSMVDGSNDEETSDDEL